MLLIFLLASNFLLCSSNNSFSVLNLNLKQMYSIPQSGLAQFLIPHSSFYNTSGTLTILAEPSSSEDTSSLTLARLQCNSSSTESNLTSEEVINREKSSVSFLANDFEDNCFQVEPNNTGNLTFINYTLQAIFYPIETTLEFNQPLTFNLDKNSDKEFTYKTSDQAFDSISIQILPETATPSNSIIPKLELRQSQAFCVETSPMFWLCHIYNRNELTRFTLHNPSSFGQYKIRLSEINAQKLLSDNNAFQAPSLPNLGSLFVVSLPLNGAFKVSARSSNGEFLLVVAAPSIQSLLEQLAIKEGSEAALGSLDYKEGSVIENREKMKQYYYYVVGKSSDPFYLSSYFIKQSVMNINTETMYFINPEIFEYQYIEVKLGKRDFPEEFQVTLQSLETESLTNLYYDTNSYEFGYSTFPNEHMYRKKAAPVAVPNSKLTLSFILGSHDTTAYITIHALKKGFFIIKAEKVEPRYLWQEVLIVSLTSFMIVYIFSCLVKVFRFMRLPEDDGISDWQAFDVEGIEPSNPQSFETETPRIEIVVADYNQEIYNSSSEEVSLPEYYVSMLERLQALEKFERLERLEKQKKIEKEENGQNVRSMTEYDEDSRCDICYEAKKTVVFEPCNHACACAFCALIIVETSAKCPLCRGQINKVQSNEKFEIQDEIKKE